MVYVFIDIRTSELISYEIIFETLTYVKMILGSNFEYLGEL